MNRPDLTPILPPRLRPNDLLAFYSPSSPATAFAPRRTARAVDFLRAQGLRLLPGALTGQRQGYRSGSIDQRAEELNALIRNPDVRCIMSTIGGANSNSLLPYLDYAALRADPKIIIGYSDATAILLAIYRRCGLVTFYGPALVASFGEYPPFVDLTYAAFRELLIDPPGTPYTYATPPIWTDQFLDWETQAGAKEARPNRWLTVQPGQASGRLIGGNLNTITGFWGSEFIPAIEAGDILLIEDSLKDAATVERLFAFLKLNGVFDRIGGIILGKHELFNDQQTGWRPHDLLIEVLRDPAMPILADFDCCHTHPMLTLPLGLRVELDATARRVTLLEPWVGG
jgi:muramoyltetrapeptide carboxypeptidase